MIFPAGILSLKSANQSRILRNDKNVKKTKDLQKHKKQNIVKCIATGKRLYSSNSFTKFEQIMFEYVNTLFTSTDHPFEAEFCRKQLFSMNFSLITNAVGIHLP